MGTPSRSVPSRNREGAVALNLFPWIGWVHASRAVRADQGVTAKIKTQDGYPMTEFLAPGGLLAVERGETNLGTPDVVEIGMSLVPVRGGACFGLRMAGACAGTGRRNRLPHHRKTGGTR